MAYEDASAPTDDFDAAVLWDALEMPGSADARTRAVSALQVSHGHEALRVYVELQRAFAVECEPEAERGQRGFVITLVAVLTAAAALLLLFTRPPSPDVPEGGTLRAPMASSVESGLDGRSLPRERFVLRWQSVGEGCRYTVRASTLEGDIITVQRDLRVPQLQLPVEGLPPGASVAWQVDFECAGERGSSRTFSTRVAP